MREFMHEIYRCKELKAQDLSRVRVLEAVQLLRLDVEICMEGYDGLLRTTGDGARGMVARHYTGSGEELVSMYGRVGCIQELECDGSCHGLCVSFEVFNGLSGEKIIVANSVAIFLLAEARLDTVVSLSL